MNPSPDPPVSRVYARAQSLFMEALSLPPGERISLFDRALRAGDESAVAEAKEMLRLYDAAPEERRPGVLSGVERSSALERLPQRIGEYDIVRVLGQGGMGRVLLGTASDDSRVAIKVLQAGLYSEDAARRFDREILVLEALRHPGIVGYLGSGWLEGDSGVRYLVMEYVDGLPLLEHAEHYELTDEERLDLLRRVCEAVGHAHAEGIIHRDLKPSNILVTASGDPKILDFGLARMLHPSVQAVSQATASGMLMGTLRYMSPEQARGTSDEIGPPADVYALGILGFEMLARGLPYSITGEETMARIFAAILTEEPSTLSQRRPELPKELDRIFGKALARVATERYTDAGALGEDIGRHLRGEPVLAPRRRRGTTRFRSLWTGMPGRVVIVALVVALVGLGSASLWRKWEQDRLLQSAYGLLSEMESMRHPPPETKEELDRMVELLTQTQPILAQLPPSDFVGHLQRFTTWRLGECYFWLGGQDGDLSQLKEARTAWNLASAFPFDRKVGERLHESVSFRSQVILDPEEAPLSGVAMISDYLAGFERPRQNLEHAANLQANLLHRHGEDPDARFTEEALNDHDVQSRAHWLGLQLHGYGSSLVSFGYVADSLTVIEEGLRLLADADTVSAFPSIEGAYRAYLRDHGWAYLTKARLTYEFADTDSALWRLRDALVHSDRDLSPSAHAAVQRLIAETRILRSSIGSRGAPPVSSFASHGSRTNAVDDELRAARESLDLAWALTDSTRERTKLAMSLVEASWYRAKAELTGPARGGASTRTEYTLSGDALSEASHWVAEAGRVVDELPYPVPRARVRLEDARVKVARVVLDPTEEIRTEALAALEACELSMPAEDWPRYQREVADLRRSVELDGDSGGPLSR